MPKETREDAETAVQERLLCEMRRLREAAGLSYGRLAERTHYSRSSWERFLNGKQLPTRVAVQQLAEAVEQDAAPLLALWDELERLSAPAVPEPPAPLPAEAGTPEAGTSEAGTSEAGTSEAGTSEAGTPEAGTPEAGTSEAAGRPVRAARWRRQLSSLCYLLAGTLLGGIITSTALNRDGSTDAGQLAGSVREAAHPAETKAPQPSCAGDTCLKGDPQAKDCQWDAVTVRETWLRGLQIQLRYSPGCKAVWGRIENGTVGDVVSIADQWHRIEEATIRVGTDTYTRMLSTADAPATTVTICGKIPSQHDQECSPDGPTQP